MLQFLEVSFFNNTVLTYLQFILALTVSMTVLKGIELIVLKHLKTLSVKTSSLFDDFLVNTIEKTLLPIAYFLAFFFSTKILALDPVLIKWINIIVLAFTIAFAAILVSSLVIFYSNKYVAKITSGANSQLLSKWTGGIIKAVVWSIALILFLDNIGIKITSLITGLGIGGIAIAFAAQTLLVDFFCCFTIFLDKPFEVGDFIVTGSQKGTVEHVGLKTTRLRSPEGEQIIISNSDLTNSRINNYKTLQERRVLFRIGVTYETAAEKLQQIPELVTDIIKSMADVRFGRAHFCAFSPYSLDFEIVYYVLSDDYDKYMDINQEVNYRIKQEFDNRGIEFANTAKALRMEA